MSKRRVALGRGAHDIVSIDDDLKRMIVTYRFLIIKCFFSCRITRFIFIQIVFSLYIAFYTVFILINTCIIHNQLLCAVQQIRIVCPV